MGRIDIILKDDVEKRFRDVVYKKYGMKRGNLKDAVNDAIMNWVIDNDPVSKSKKINGSKPLLHKSKGVI